MDSQRRRQKTPSPMMILLLIELYKQFDRLPVKPPITIGLLGLNLFVHLHPNPYLFGIYLDDIRGNCIQPYRIINAFYYHQEVLWNRLFLSSIIHGDDMHLYYNMLSLSWKGINLENQVGSPTFLGMVIFSLVVSHCLLVGIAYSLYTFLGWDEYSSGMNTCAVGFSAVLFSLKYIWNAKSSSSSSNSQSSYTNVMGISVPTRYAAWLELVVTSMITPNASFIGHLAGILAGVLYVHAPTFPMSMIPNVILQKIQLLFQGNHPEEDHHHNNNSNTYYTFEDADYRAYQNARMNNNDSTNNTNNNNNSNNANSSSRLNSEELRQQRLNRLNKKFR